MSTDDELSSPETADRVHAYLQGQPVASIREIARALGVGRSTAARAVKRLTLDGRLSRERLGTGRGYPTRYSAPAPELASPDADTASGEPPPIAPSRQRTRRGRRSRKPRQEGDR